MAVPPYGRPINTSVVVSPLLHPKTVLIPLLVSELEPQNYFQGGTANVGDSEFLLINPSKLDTRVKNEYVLKKICTLYRNRSWDTPICGKKMGRVSSFGGGVVGSKSPN